jgi:hypothetical protein
MGMAIIMDNQVSQVILSGRPLMFIIPEIKRYRKEL